MASAVGDDDEEMESFQAVEPHMSLSVIRRLYVSHFLSTWNTRVFEFGAVLYLASIFPDNLLPLSTYALVRGISAILLSPAVGQYIDTSDRLKVVKISIVFQRLAVALSCIIFWTVISGWITIQGVKWWALAALSALACVEKLCSIMNLISVERDWVVVIAGDRHEDLGVLNSQMRRIDLFCKLAGPFAIGLFDGISTKVAITTNLAMDILSVAIEYYAITKVHAMVPALRTSKRGSGHSPSIDQTTELDVFRQIWVMVQRVKRILAHQLTGYFCHRAMIPSFACAILYFTVLSFSGQMVTYLLFVGFTSVHVAIVRTLSVAVELSATFVAPMAMSKVGPIRAGIWFINWQAICLIIGAGWFWSLSSSTLSAIGLVVATILSRVGLWGFDLCIQIIVQEEVNSDQRGSFSTTEAAWQNFFELLSYIATMVFYRPDQFRWPVLMSAVGVTIAQGLYAIFVRARRGHLVHLPLCMDIKGWGTRESTRYEPLPGGH